MKMYKPGGFGPARDGARPDHMKAANDLVRETLSRQGLWPADGGAELPLNDLMQGLQGLPGGGLQSKAKTINLPEGAEFRAESHAGRTGSRAYRRYVPASAADGAEGVILMLHGCTQNPEDFALGTKMNALAEAHRLVVIYPEQSRGANAQTCWNWFNPGDQRRDRGEPEILAGIARKVRDEHGVPADRVFVAGLSAGAAMAAILGETYADTFAAVGVHSGLPFGAARDMPSAFAAMGGDLSQGAVAPAPSRSVPTIVFHGTADRTVHPGNGGEVARRAVSRAQSVESVEKGTQGGRGFRRVLNHDAGGRLLSEHWLVEGLGHAWSGGDRAGTYADPAGPDASAEMVRFFLSVAEGKA